MSSLSCNLRRQRRSIVGIIPSSAATSVCMRPLVSHSATASRLNSSVNRRFVVLVVIHLLAQRSLSSSVKSREDQCGARRPEHDIVYASRMRDIGGHRHEAAGGKTDLWIAVLPEQADRRKRRATPAGCSALF